jgi:hypothetical protein
MAEIVAIPVSGVESITAADDGQHALLKIRLSDQEAVLALPEAVLRPLLVLICNGIAQTAMRQARQETTVFPVSRWELGRTEAGALAVTFRLENGASLSFALGADQIPHMRQNAGSNGGQASFGNFAEYAAKLRCVKLATTVNDAMTPPPATRAPPLVRRGEEEGG